MKKNEASCGCDADLKEELNEMVNDVEGYGKADREQKGREVKAAFKSSAKKEEKAVKK